MSSGQTRAKNIQGALYAGLILGCLYGLSLLFEVRFTVPYQVLAILATVVGYILFAGFDLATPWHIGRPGAIGTRLLWTWASFVGGVLFLGYVTKYTGYFSRELLVAWFFVTPVAMLLLHLLVYFVVQRFLPDLSVRRSAVIVFVNESSRQLAKNLQKSPFYELSGFFDDRDMERVGGGLEGATFLGRTRGLVKYVRDEKIQVVFVVLPGDGIKRALAVLDDLSDTTASTYFVPDFFVFNLLQAQVSEIEGIPVLEVAETPFYGVDGIAKQLFDIVVASLILVLMSPVLLLIGLAVKLTSKGPVIFTQKRYGLNGEEFGCYKFRSMYVSDDDKQRELQQATRDDPRITPVGRFLRRTSMDELPQFFNVLQGHMSIVGPRPHSVAHNEQYRRAVKRYMVRHKVKPGVTGWAQVHGLRGETAQIERMEDRIDYDLQYIRRWSPWLDVKIILMTIVMVFRDRNAY